MSVFNCAARDLIAFQPVKADARIGPLISHPQAHLISLLLSTSTCILGPLAVLRRQESYNTVPTNLSFPQRSYAAAPQKLEIRKNMISTHATATYA
jgi:hypothetical protein